MRNRRSLRTPEIVELIVRRQRLGLDRNDEVWEGQSHVAPEVSFGLAYTQTQIHAYCCASPTAWVAVIRAARAGEAGRAH